MEQTTPSPSVSWSPRRVILATLVVVAIAAAFWLLFRFRIVFFSLFVAIVISTAIKPLIDRLTAWKISRTVSIILVSLVFLLLIAVLFVTLIPLISEQWATITSLLANWYQELRSALLESSSLIVRRIARQLPNFLPLTLPQPQPEDVEGDTLEVVQQATTSGAAVLRSLLIVLGVGLMANFWILEGDRATRLLLLAVSPARRETIRQFIQDLEDKVGAYTRGLVILCTIIGVMQTGAYLIIGLPNVLLLGILAGLMEAVPLIGPLLGAIPAFVVAAAYDPSKVIWVVVSTVVIQALENNLVAPRVMDKAVGINPVASLLAFIAFSSIFGLVGALLAIPLAAVIQVVLKYFLFQQSPTEASPPAGRDAVSALRYDAQDLVQDVRKQVRDKDAELDESADKVEDEMEAIVQDLDSILAEAELKENRNGKRRRSRNGGEQRR